MKTCPSTLILGYKLYRKQFSKVNQTLYKDICKRFFKGLLQLIVEKSFNFRMPYNLGYLRIVQFKHSKFEDGKLVKNKVKVNYGETIKHYAKIWGTGWKETQRLMREKKESGEVLMYIYHFNDHTSNNNYRWQWDKEYAYSNRKFFLFKPVKDARLRLSSFVQNNKIQYLENFTYGGK